MRDEGAEIGVLFVAEEADDEGCSNEEHDPEDGEEETYLRVAVHA